MAPMTPRNPRPNPDLRGLRWQVPAGAALVLLMSVSPWFQSAFLALGERIWSACFADAAQCEEADCALYEIGVRVLSGLAWLAVAVALAAAGAGLRGLLTDRLARMPRKRAIVGLMLLGPLSELAVGTGFGWVLLAQGDLLHWLFSGAGLLYGVEALIRLERVSVNYFGSFNDSSTREFDLRVWIVGVWAVTGVFWLVLLPRQTSSAPGAQPLIDR